MINKFRIQYFLAIGLIACLVVITGTGLAQASWRQNLPTESSTFQVAQAPQSPIEINEDLAQATVTYLLEDVPNPTQQPEVVRTVLVEDYALVTWYWGDAGGQTVLSQTDGAWNVLSSGGGAVDVAILEEVGVPTAIAQQLMAQDQAAQQLEFRQNLFLKHSESSSSY